MSLKKQEKMANGPEDPSRVKQLVVNFENFNKTTNYTNNQKEEEDLVKQLLYHFFDMVDTDKNGVITLPEFTTLAMKFSPEGEKKADLVSFML